MRFVRVNESGIVKTIIYSHIRILDTDIQTDTATEGQVLQEDGSFINYVPTEEEIKVTLDTILKAKLIEDMKTANAFRDDAAWQIAKDKYDAL